MAQETAVAKNKEIRCENLGAKTPNTNKIAKP